MTSLDRACVLALAGVPALAVALGHPSFVIGWLIGAFVMVFASLVRKRRP